MLEEYKDVLTVDEICNILHIGRSTAYLLLQNNEIPNKRIRKKYIVAKENFIKYLTGTVNREV